MEQIVQALYIVFVFFSGFYLGYRTFQPREVIVFVNCSHGFENDGDCREYITGERDGALRVNNTE